MIRPRLVLHIGEPKTGSSSIQQALFGRKFLCDTCTLDYPDSLNAFPLARALKSDAAEGLAEARFGPYAQWLAASRRDVAVISAEQFSLLPAAQIAEAFQTYFPDHANEMTVVGYARPHVSRFLSAYAQRTKAGLLHASLEDFLAGGGARKLLKFHKRFAGWRVVFGERFILRPVVREVLQDGDVVADFIGIALGGAPFRLTGTTEANSSMSLEALAGVRFMHRVLQKFNVGAFVQHAIGGRVSTLVAQAAASGTKLRVSSAMYERLHSMCVADAVALDRDFFDPPVMTQALDLAANDVVPELQDWDARTIYPTATQKAFRQNARGLVALFEKHPGVWEAAYRRYKGHAAASANAPLSESEVAVIEQVEAILAETVAIIISVDVGQTQPLHQIGV